MTKSGSAASACPTSAIVSTWYFRKCSTARSNSAAASALSVDSAQTAFILFHDARSCRIRSGRLLPPSAPSALRRAVSSGDDRWRRRAAATIGGTRGVGRCSSQRTGRMSSRRALHEECAIARGDLHSIDLSHDACVHAPQGHAVDQQRAKFGIGRQVRPLPLPLREGDGGGGVGSDQAPSPSPSRRGGGDSPLCRHRHSIGPASISAAILRCCHLPSRQRALPRAVLHHHLAAQHGQARPRLHLAAFPRRVVRLVQILARGSPACPPDPARRYRRPIPPPARPCADTAP